MPCVFDGAPSIPAGERTMAIRLCGGNDLMGIKLSVRERSLFRCVAALVAVTVIGA